MARNLTEKQQKFLDVLFEEAQGDPVQAKKLAGYADSVASTSVVNSLTDEIADVTKKVYSTVFNQSSLHNVFCYERSY